MPSVSQSYEVLLDFTNDTHDTASLQMLRDYGRTTNRAVLLKPGETISLVLDAGDSYKYTLKTKSRVVNITYVMIDVFHYPLCLRTHFSTSARAWRDVVCDLSILFHPGSARWPPSNITSRLAPNGITVDRHFRETRFCIFDYRDT